jgi:glycosyltransferase involved in cell wall biosynthesis
MSAHIGLLMMLKDEERRLPVTLKSTVGFVDSIIVYDTGSTDRTIEILKEHCKKHDVPLHLKEGKFVNFALSRNISLDFADEIKEVDFLLLLDCNDELQGGDFLRKIADKYLETDDQAFLVCQKWFSGKNDKYYNTRFIRSKCGWRYKGSVHEWLSDIKNNGKPKKPVIRLTEQIIIFQDRTKDNNKSGSRYKRDKELLLEDHKKNPQEPRTLFYLAQTCSCLQQVKESFKYYLMRTKLEGFWEERFHAFFRCGEYSQKLKMPWEKSLEYYMKALEVNVRAEPLVQIAEYYRMQKKWLLSFSFVSWACSLDYPRECILFVDSNMYKYKRWHIMGIVSFYCGKYKEGKIGCLKALETDIHKELNLKNLQFYLNKLGKNSNSKSGPFG